jgi:hypothetical protein
MLKPLVMLVTGQVEKTVCRFRNRVTNIHMLVNMIVCEYEVGGGAVQSDVLDAILCTVM